MLAIRKAFSTFDWDKGIESFENEISILQKELDTAYVAHLQKTQAEYLERVKVSMAVADTPSNMEKNSAQPLDILELKDDYSDEVFEFPIYNQNQTGIDDPEFQAALQDVPQYRQVDDDCPTEDAVREWATNMTSQYMTTVIDLFRTSFGDDNVKERMAKLRRQYVLYLKK